MLFRFRIVICFLFLLPLANTGNVASAAKRKRGVPSVSYLNRGIAKRP